MYQNIYYLKMLITFINSPIEQFEIVPLLLITGPFVGNWVIALTNFTLYIIIIVGLIVGLHTFADNSYRLIPSPWSVMLESLFVTVHGFVRDQIGEKNEVFLPFIYALFILLLIGNLNGNIPYGFAVTSSAIITICLSIIVFIGVTIIGISKHGVHFASFFLPAGTPLVLVPILVLIELISYIARAFSLGLRALANVLAGHILLTILAGFMFTLFTSSILIAVVTLIPFAIFVALIGLEIGVMVIKAYVFTVLTSSYIKDAIDLH